jgi:hypothetical protein
MLIFASLTTLDLNKDYDPHLQRNASTRASVAVHCPPLRNLSSAILFHYFKMDDIAKYNAIMLPSDGK